MNFSLRNLFFSKKVMKKMKLGWTRPKNAKRCIFKFATFSSERFGTFFTGFSSFSHNFQNPRALRHSVGRRVSGGVRGGSRPPASQHHDPSSASRIAPCPCLTMGRANVRIHVSIQVGDFSFVGRLGLPLEPCRARRPSASPRPPGAGYDCRRP